MSPGTLPELLLERSQVTEEAILRPATGARIKGLHLDRRIIDLRKRRHRQLAKGDNADQDDAGHEQRGGDGPKNEDSGRVHA